MSLLLLFAGGAPAAGQLLPSLGDLATINGPDDVIGAAYGVVAPTLGDLATINGPTITTPYALPLPTLGDGATLNAPNVFLYEPLHLPSIGGGPVPGGLWIEVAAEPTPTPTPGVPVARSDTVPARRIVVRVCDPANPATVLATLDEARRERWQKVLSEHGTGSCVLQNDDPDLAAAAYGRLLRWEVDGRATFLSIIEGRDQVLISQQEDVDEATEVGGRGVLAQWDDAVVYPEAGATGRPFSDQRVLNWTSADFDDSGWAVVKVGERIGDVHQRELAFGTGVPGNAVAKGFPDGSARVIWAYGSGDTGGAGAGNTPPGLAYLRKTFTVGTAGWYRFFVSADDGASVVIDGVQLYQEARLWFHLETQSVDVYLSAGVHQLAMRVENLDNGNLAGNSGWGLLSAMAMTEDGELGAVLVRTDSTWKGVAYPPKPPGFTVGRAIRVLLEEAQARGALLGWTLGFTDTADSAGRPWAEEPELAFQCGMDLYSVLQELAEAYVELDVAPAQLVLYAYADGYGQVSGVTYAEAASILALAHTGSV